METSFNLKDRLKEAKKEMVMDGEDSLQFEGWVGLDKYKSHVKNSRYLRYL